MILPMLLALRLLAVYFGTAAGAIWLCRRFVRRVPLSAALFLALAPFLLHGRALLRGQFYGPADILYQAPPYATRAAAMGIGATHNPSLGDVVYQSVPWRKASREAIRHGRLPLWNRFLLTGEPLLAVEQAAIFNPTSWIGCLLPLPQAWTYEMALHTFLAALAAYLLFADLGLGVLAALLGACAWAFSDWLVFFAGWVLAPAAAPFPLLLLGLRRMARARTAGESRRSIALTVAALVLIVASGHPETLLYCVAGGGLYFLFELAWAGRDHWRAGLGRSLWAGVLTLGITAVQLIPFVEALPHTQEHAMRSSYFAHLRKSLPPAESLHRTATTFVPYAYGVAGLGTGEAEIVEPAAYAGAVLLPLALLGLASKRREKWALLAVGGLAFAVFLRLVGVTDLLDSLPLFDIGVNDRLIFLAAFATAGLAALGAERLEEEEGGVRAYLVAAGGSALALAGLFLLLRPGMAAAGLTSSYIGTRFAQQLLPLLLSLAAVAVLGRRRRQLAVAACLLLLLAQRGVEATQVYPTSDGEALHPRLPILDHAMSPVSPGSRDPWRFVAIGFTLIPNSPALYELEDVRGYEAMTFHPLFDTFPLWCQHQPVSFNRVDDATRPFLSFLNVRWALASRGGNYPAGWTKVHEDSSGVLFENPAVLPRAFVPRQVYREPDRSRDLAVLQTIEDFGARGVADAAPGAVPPRTWVDNGRATVAIERYETQELVLAVDAAAPALIATSQVAWPGWQLEIDGRRAPTATYNHAFVGFLAPAGKHRAVLHYLPGSFLLGAGLSLLSLLAAAVLGWRSRAAERLRLSR